MACVEFTPVKVTSGGLLSSSTFTDFSVLVDSANQWLREHASCRVLNCETITIKSTSGSARGFDAAHVVVTDHYDTGGENSTIEPTAQIKALRLWYVPDNSGPPLRLACTTLAPVGYQEETSYSVMDFNTMLDKYNQQIQRRPPPGYILNIETVKHHEGGGEVTRCVGSSRTTLVRIWYIVTPDSVPEEIGCADFVPQPVGGRSSDEGDGAGYEDYKTVFRRAQSWLQCQSGIRFVNIQSLYLKIKNGNLDSKRTVSEYRHGTNVFQFIRLWFVKPLTAVSLPQTPSISYCTIQPQEVRPNCSYNRFESLHDVTTRYYQWLLQCGARILSVDSLAVPWRTSTGHNPELSVTRLKLRSLVHARVYFEGEFMPPSRGTVQPPPEPDMETTDDDCCILL